MSKAVWNYSGIKSSWMLRSLMITVFGIAQGYSFTQTDTKS